MSSASSGCEPGQSSVACISRSPFAKRFAAMLLPGLLCAACGLPAAEVFGPAAPKVEETRKEQEWGGGTQEGVSSTEE